MVAFTVCERRDMPFENTSVGIFFCERFFFLFYDVTEVFCCFFLFLVYFNGGKKGAGIVQGNNSNVPENGGSAMRANSAYMRHRFLLLQTMI